MQDKIELQNKREEYIRILDNTSDVNDVKNISEDLFS